LLRAAFVLGFGYGRANQHVATLVAHRHQANAFHVILAQEAVIDELNQIVSHATIRRMHKHGIIYVNTLDALGLGFLRLSEIIVNAEPCEVEIFAHRMQYKRAIYTGKNALLWLKNCQSAPGRFKQFMASVTFLQRPSPPPMPLNLWRESWRQPWTCHVLIYQIVDAIALRRDFLVQGNKYDKDTNAFYDHLMALLQKIGKAE